MTIFRPLAHIIFLASVFVILVAPAGVRAASGYCVPLIDGKEYRLEEVRQLSPATPESPSGLQNEFHTDALFLFVLEGERVLLSGSETGSSFVTDDEFTLETIPAERTQTWNFQSEDRMSIVPQHGPVDITHLFLEDRFNMVQVSMTDILPPAYRNSELWLMRYRPCNTTEPVVEATPPTAIPTETPVLVPTDEPMMDREDVATLESLSEASNQMAMESSAAVATTDALTDTSALAETPPITTEMPTTMEDSPVQTVPVTPISLGLILIGLVIYWLITTGTLKSLPSWKEIKAQIEERLKE